MSFFDCNSVEDTNFRPLAKGWYPSVIVSYDFRDNKKRNGKVLEIEFETLSSIKKKIKNYYNIQHENKTCESIGRSSFKEVCMSVDLPKIESQSDLALLVGKKIGIKLGIKEYDGKEYNEILDINNIDAIGIDSTPEGLAPQEEIDVPF